MEKKKLQSLISSIFIVLCGVLILLALFIPYFRYETTAEEIKGNKSFFAITFSLFDGDLPVYLSAHFEKLSTRSWLMIMSDVTIILGVVSIIATFIIAVLELLCILKNNVPALGYPDSGFAKIVGVVEKIRNWYGLGLIILGSLFLLSSFIFFLGSNNVYKLGTHNGGYTIRQFKGHVGWWFMAVCPMVAGILAFRKGLKKFNLEKA